MFGSANGTTTVPPLFTLQTSGIAVGIAVVVRDDQQPNVADAVQVADPNVKFVAMSLTNSRIGTSTIPAATTTTTTPAATASAKRPETSTSTPAAPSRLRAGTKAGIAVGVVVSGALAVSGAFFYFGFFCRRHRSVHWSMHPVSDKSELARQPAAVELDPTGVEPELTAQTPRWEMESGRETCE